MSTDPRDPQPHDGSQHQPPHDPQTGAGVPQQPPHDPQTGAGVPQQQNPYSQHPPQDPYAGTGAHQAPPGYGPQPMSPSEERNLGMLAHVIPAILLPLSAGTLGFVASLVIYLIYKDRGPFVRQHAANSLNVQIIAAIGLVISSILVIVLIGIVLYPLVIVAAVVIHIIGAIKANNGEWWMPPLTPALVK